MDRSIRCFSCWGLLVGARLMNETDKTHLANLLSALAQVDFSSSASVMVRAIEGRILGEVGVE